ncbi:MAG TPA: phospholipid scramblase-related protein [Myxococcus sp.]|nr:phospholipid scramblase-related protein [Myxococcus sp.]
MSDKPPVGKATELELDWGSRERRAPGPEGEAPQAPPEPVALGAPGKGAPGDPRNMSPEMRLAISGLLEAPSLRMRQFRSTVEMLVPWEARNQYEVCDENGRVSVFVGETGGGLGSALLRNFWPFHKIRLECMTPGGTLAMVVERPWTLLFARAEVEAWDGRPLGRVQQRFTLLGRKLELQTPAGVVLATVEGPWWKPWTFRVKQKGAEVAVIRKQWSGLLQEALANADNFGLEFTPECTDGRLRQLILAAALLVDLTYFERGDSNSGSLLSWLPD